jgi:hypothetical protein
MTTIQKSSRKSCWCLRTISRRRRRTRLRTTALPSRPLVIKPARLTPEFCTARAARTMNLPRSAWPAPFTRSKSEVRVRRRVFGKANKRAPCTSIIDLAIHNRTGGFCRTAKVFPRERSREDCLQANDEPRLRRRRRIHVDIRLRLSLRLGLRRWRFFLIYDRGFLLLSWWICHRSFFVLATPKECGPGKDENMFFHNGRKLDVKTKALVRWQVTRRLPLPDSQLLLSEWWQLGLLPAQ